MVYTIYPPCQCEHNDPDSLDARLFPSVVLAVAPAVTMDEATGLTRILILPQGVRAGAVNASSSTWVHP